MVTLLILLSSMFTLEGTASLVKVALWHLFTKSVHDGGELYKEEAVHGGPGVITVRRREPDPPDLPVLPAMLQPCVQRVAATRPCGGQGGQVGYGVLGGSERVHAVQPCDLPARDDELLCDHVH